ncbi:MAG: hypothetical protein J0I41_12570 [Filimonas sp.]|nr:hypothetical protein [Filimonas sp.]
MKIFMTHLFILALVYSGHAQDKQLFSRKIVVQYPANDKGSAEGKPDTISIAEYRNGKCFKIWSKRTRYGVTREDEQFFDDNNEMKESVKTIYIDKKVEFKKHFFYDPGAFISIKEIDLLKEDQTPVVTTIKRDSIGRIVWAHSQSDYTVISYSANGSVVIHNKYNDDGNLLLQATIVMDSTKKRVLSSTQISTKPAGVELERLEYNNDGIMTGSKAWMSSPLTQAEKDKLKDMPDEEKLIVIKERLRTTDLTEEIHLNVNKDKLTTGGTKKIYERGVYKNYILKYFYQ